MDSSHVLLLDIYPRPDFNIDLIWVMVSGWGSSVILEVTIFGEGKVAGIEHHILKSYRKISGQGSRLNASSDVRKARGNQWRAVEPAGSHSCKSQCIILFSVRLDFRNQIPYIHEVTSNGQITAESCCCMLILPASAASLESKLEEE